MDRYEEIIENMHSLIANAKKMGHVIVRIDDIEGIIPEIKEVKDSKMIDAIASSLTCDSAEKCLNTFGVRLSDALAWLERQRSKMPPKWLYRLEYKDDSCGLWYDGNGNWCFNNGIGALGDSCITKNLPMDYDERYKQDGRSWFSSCSNKEDLLHWYSMEDAKTLLNNGFVFTRYLATEYHEYEKETVFIKETALFREEIDFFELKFDTTKS